jgi:hypothetical protein
VQILIFLVKYLIGGLRACDYIARDKFFRKVKSYSFRYTSQEVFLFHVLLVNPLVYLQQKQFVRDTCSVIRY